MDWLSRSRPNNTTRNNRSFLGKLYNRTQKVGKRVNSFLGKGPQPAKILAPGLYVPPTIGRDEFLPVPPHIAEAIKNQIVKTCIENIQKIDQDGKLTTKEKAGAITAYIDMLLDGGDYVRIPRVNENGMLVQNNTIPGIISLEESNTGRYTQNAKSFTKIVLIAAGIIGVTGAIVATAPISVPVIAMFSYAYATSGVTLTNSTPISVARSNIDMKAAKKELGFQNVVFMPISEEAWNAEQELRKKLEFIYNAPSARNNNTTKNKYKDIVLSYIQTEPDFYRKQEQLEKYINKLIRKSEMYDSRRYDILKEIVIEFSQKKSQQGNLSRYMVGGARKHHKPSSKTRKNKKSRRHH